MLELKKLKCFIAESGEYQRVVAFLKGIPQNVLAKASLRSKAYTRALMHFEAYILENKENIQDHLTFLQVRQQQRSFKCTPFNNVYTHSIFF